MGEISVDGTVMGWGLALLRTNENYFMLLSKSRLFFFWY